MIKNLENKKTYSDYNTNQTTTLNQENYSVLSLFSGAGGMDLGFKQAGFNIVFANDFDEDACITYSKNIDDNIICRDISQIKDDEIPKNVDVLIGGFPCQGFSIANKNRHVNDKRNHLYKEMIKIIAISNPKIVVAENVKGILSLGKGIIFKQIKNDLENLGYEVDYKICNTAYFGIPQFRERVIIIANKIGVHNIFPKETHNNYNLITTKDVCGFLSNVEINYNPIVVNNRIIYNHIASQMYMINFGEENIK